VGERGFRLVQQDEVFETKLAIVFDLSVNGPFAIVS
jgi:hypothetical protein